MSSKNILLISIAIIAFLTIFFLRLWIQSSQEYKRALIIETKYQNDNNFFHQFRVINSFEKSCHLYFPLSPYFTKSIKRLMALGQKFEEENKTKLAKYAWLAAKGCIMVNRSFYIPGKEYLPEINTHIAKLFNDPQALERPNIKDPSLLFSLLMLVGLFTWIGSVIAIIMLKGKNVKFFYFLFVGGYILWVISIYLL